MCKNAQELALARDIDFVTYFTESALTEEQQKALRAQCKAAKFDIKPIKKDKAPELQLDAAQLNAESALEPWVKTTAGDLDQTPLLELGRDLLSVGQGHGL